MNQKLIQINQLVGAVVDHNSNINVISKYNNEYTFEEILKTENELEELYNHLSNCNLYSKMNKLYITLAGLSIGSLVAIPFFSNTVQPEASIGLIPIELLGSGCAIYFFNKYIKDKKNLNKNIKEDKEKVLELSSKLQKMKELTKYSVSDINSDNDGININDYILKIKFQNINSSSNEVNNIKILQLIEK